MFKYGVFSAAYFPVFSPNTGKYGSEQTQYLATFHVVTFFTGNSVCNTDHKEPTIFGTILVIETCDGVFLGFG